MGGAYSMHEGDLGVHRRVMFKWILKKQDVWFKMETNGKFLRSL
jgi:hypothetical protein